MTDNEHSKYLRDRGTVYDHVIADFIDSTLLKLHQLSEDHSHCEGLLHELGERASRAESRLRTLAIGIVGARMAHVEEDYSEAYHLLYSAARALSDDPHEPWKAVDALADGAIERRDGQTFVNLPKDAERHPDDIDGDGICPINCESPEVRCGLPVGHGGPHRVVEKQPPIKCLAVIASNSETRVLCVRPLGHDGDHRQ